MKKTRIAIDLVIGSITRAIVFRKSKIQNNKIVFTTYNDNYMCNPKYIAKEITRRELPYDLVWAVPAISQADLSQFPVSLRLVKRGYYEFFEELATAKVWVDNALNCEWSALKKKDEQVYINTWHGSMGLKRIGTNDVRDFRWNRAAKRVRRFTDYVVSNSDFENAVYRSTHFPDTEIWEFGHPRNDMLCIADPEAEAKLRKQIASQYKFKTTDKLFLYAPTFRDSTKDLPPSIDFNKVIDNLEERFGGTWRVLVRMHFHDRKHTFHGRGRYASRIIDMTEYIDMQELLVVADAGMTDYSSWCCDYVLSGKPCFLYTPDLKKYEKSRGFYYPLTETPFPLAKNMKELLSNISNFNDEDYQRKCKEFLQKRGSFEDGQAAKRVVDKIVEVIDAVQATQAAPQTPDQTAANEAPATPQATPQTTDQQAE